MNKLISYILLITFTSSPVCLADVSRENLAPNISLQQNNLHVLFTRTGEDSSALFLVKDAKGIKALVHRAYAEEDDHAHEILKSLAKHNLASIRVMFACDLSNSNPKTILGSDIWKDYLEKDPDPAVKAQVKKTEAILNGKEVVLDGVSHHFRNKMVSSGGYLVRMERILYAPVLAGALKLKEKDYKKALKVIEKDGFYKEKLKISSKGLLDKEKAESLELMRQQLSEAEVDVSADELEIGIYRADKTAGKRADLNRVIATKKMGEEIESEVEDLVYNFQGSDDDLAFFIVEKFGPITERMMQSIAELKEVFTDDKKMLRYLEIVELETSHIYNLVRNLKKAVRIAKINLARLEIGKTIESAEREFKKEYADKPVKIRVKKMPLLVEAVASRDFPELLSGVFRMIDVFMDRDKTAVLDVQMQKRANDVRIRLRFRGKKMEARQETQMLAHVLKPFTDLYTLESYDANIAFFRMRNVLRAFGGKMIPRTTREGDMEIVISLPLLENYAFVNKTILRLSEVLGDSLKKTAQIKGSSVWNSHLLKDRDRQIIDTYEQNLQGLFSIVKKYLNAEIGFEELLTYINSRGGSLLSAYETIGILSGYALYAAEDLQANGMLEISLLMDLLIPSYLSMSRIDVRNIISETLSEISIGVSNKMPEINVEIDPSVISAGLSLSTYPNEFRMLLNEFLKSAVLSGAIDVKIKSMLENRALVTEINADFDVPTTNLEYDASLINAVGERTGGDINITRDQENKSVIFSFSLPVTADLDTAPLEEDVSEYLGPDRNAVIVLSGLRGSKRNSTAHFLESRLGMKRFNLGFWMRVITYYVSKENPGLFNEISDLGTKISRLKEIGGDNQAVIDDAEKRIKTLIVEECVPYIQTLLGRIDFQADPITIDGKDTAAIAKDGDLSIRDKVKMLYTSPGNKKFLYKFTGNPEIQELVDEYIWKEVDKVLASKRYNGVVIISTDPKLIPESLSGKAHNFYLNASAEVRSRSLLQQHTDDLSIWDKFTGRDYIPVEEIQKLAEVINVSENGLDMKVGSIAGFVLDWLKQNMSYPHAKKQRIRDNLQPLFDQAI